MRNFVFTMLALVIAPSLAMAGGGNSKEDPTLEVINNANRPALVVIDNFTNTMKDADTPAEFQEAGGFFLEENGGSTDEQDVKAGGHTVFYYYPEGPNDIPEMDDFASISVIVAKDEEKVVYIPGD